MKFFKHFTDAHRGKSLKQVLRSKGYRAVGIYWTLVEICAEKMEKEKDEEYAIEHCVFEFDKWYLRDTLQTHQLSNLMMYLQCFTDVGLMSYTCVDDVVTMSMPKLLEYLDRDAKRARTVRAPSAPKIKRKIKRKIKNKEVVISNVDDWRSRAFTALYEKLKTTVERRRAIKFRRGSDAEHRFMEQMSTEHDADMLQLAIEEYGKYLDAMPTVSPRTSFETFLGTERSGKPWLQYAEDFDLGPGVAHA